jgi:hypothetical protein
MTVSKQLTVFCDRCFNWSYVDALTKQGARAELKKHGWRVILDKDVCPEDHNKKDPEGR